MSASTPAAAMVPARTVAAAADAGVPETWSRDAFPLDRLTWISYLNRRPGGYGEKVSRELPKLKLRVRFPLPAPTHRKTRILGPTGGIGLVNRRFAARRVLSD